MKRPSDIKYCLPLNITKWSADSIIWEILSNIIDKKIIRGK